MNLRNPFLVLFLGISMVAGCVAPPDEAASGDEDADADDVGASESAITGAYDGTSETTDHQRINRRRATIGKGALTRRACLNSIARAWSLKMATANQLSHNPNLSTQVQNRCTGLRWRRLGENVGVGGSELQIWNALMASAPHKANIEGAYDSVGIGIYKRSDGTMFLTQVFADF